MRNWPVLSKKDTAVAVCCSLPRCWTDRDVASNSPAAANSGARTVKRFGLCALACSARRSARNLFASSCRCWHSVCFFLPRAPLSPYRAPVTVRQKKANKKRAPNCTGSSLRAWSRARSAGRASRRAKTWYQNASEGVGSQCWGATKLQSAKQQASLALNGCSHIRRVREGGCARSLLLYLSCCDRCPMRALRRT